MEQLEALYRYVAELTGRFNRRLNDDPEPMRHVRYGFPARASATRSSSPSCTDYTPARHLAAKGPPTRLGVNKLQGPKEVPRHDATSRPKRMRYSYEARCRAVDAIFGMSPADAARNVGASRASGCRWLRRYRTGGWGGLREHPSTPKRQPRSSHSGGGGRDRGCARAAEQARSRSAPYSGVRPRPSARCCAASVARGCRASPDPRWCATSATVRASCCTSTSRSWGASSTSASPSSRTGSSAARAPTGSTSTSPSTTTHGWRTLRCARPPRRRPHLPRSRANVVLGAGHHGRGGDDVERAVYRSAAWRERCAERRLRHLRTRPYTPRTNGKAEQFIQILLRNWAYAFAYSTSAHRTRALAGWLRWYNRRRPHGSLGGLPPVSRVSHLPGQYTLAEPSGLACLHLG